MRWTLTVEWQQGSQHPDAALERTLTVVVSASSEADAIAIAERWITEHYDPYVVWVDVVGVEL